MTTPAPEPVEAAAAELAAAEEKVRLYGQYYSGKVKVRHCDVERVMAEYDRMRAVLADPTDEDYRLIYQALDCADTGNAGHWPTAAGILADEVRRLRVLMRECLGATCSLTEFDRVSADLSRALPVVEAAGALVEQWTEIDVHTVRHMDAGFAKRLDALARSVRAARKPWTGEGR